MSDNINQIEQFLNWYRLIYGEEHYLEGELTSPETGETAVQKTRTRQDVPITMSRIINQLSPSLRQFYDEIKNCQKCPLSKLRTHFVFGMGNPRAKVVFVGEAPGKEEDEKGVPFVGKAGKLLDKMLAAIELSRQDIFIANVLKCRPPNNRDPLPEEVISCEPYLKKQLELIQPELLVALGRVAAQVLLKQYESLSDLRRETRNYEGIPLIVTYHPAALLRNPQWKRNAWQDLKNLKQLLDGKR